MDYLWTMLTIIEILALCVLERRNGDSFVPTVFLFAIDVAIASSWFEFLWYTKTVLKCSLKLRVYGYSCQR